MEAKVGVVCGRVVMVDGASFGGDTIMVTDDPAFDEAWEFVSMAASSLGATDTGVSSSSLAVVGVASGETENFFLISGVNKKNRVDYCIYFSAKFQGGI